ncbi:hypothetical protein TVAG_467490 [Trichomonas vaginalis G3]|uniref:Uncharacterized protein n=1 Tax=Trichomonas vaginalis (strain ATCC PRA-98 / G3) TaxID=412133 RepID=A2H0E7_TRIV3|nr:hypothetical protein TVAG_467490 [Trichomonas vaginalis G3]|eukprot:XP_001290050.1 hypothetical protein [Trichomonas vaginalis G3]
MKMFKKGVYKTAESFELEDATGESIVLQEQLQQQIAQEQQMQQIAQE